MDAQAFEDTTLPYVLVKPQGAELDGSLPLVVMLHGLGANMYDLASLSGAIDDTGYVYAFPQAPYRMNYGAGQYGYSWFADRQGVEPPPPDSPPLEALLEDFMSDVTQRTGTQRGQAVLGGFSQGGGLTLNFGLSRPDDFKGLAVLSGFFRDPEGTAKRLPSDRAQPVFITHGTHDQVVPLEHGRSTKRFLEDAGYAPEYHEYPMAHEITQDEIGDLTAWLHQTLPRKS